DTYAEWHHGWGLLIILLSVLPWEGFHYGRYAPWYHGTFSNSTGWWGRVDAWKKHFVSGYLYPYAPVYKCCKKGHKISCRYYAMLCNSCNHRKLCYQILQGDGILGGVWYNTDITTFYGLLL